MTVNEGDTIDEPICPDCDAELRDWGRYQQCPDCGRQFKRQVVEYEYRALSDPVHK